MNRDDPRHGTYAGFRRHIVTGTPSCGSCRLAAARYQNMREMDLQAGRPRAVSPVGARRRLQGLVHLGYSYSELAPHLEVSAAQVHKWAANDHAFIRSSTADRIATVCRRLAMQPAPPSRNATYARTVAKRNGWLPLLAWDDIDDEGESPDDWQYREPTRAELIAEMIERGDGISHACRALGVSKSSLEKWCARNDMSAEFTTLKEREYVKQEYRNQFSREAS